MNFFKRVWEKEQPVCSLEFFPAKSEDSEKQFLKTAERLQSYQTDFVSITYGAGGSSREQTLRYGKLLRDHFGYEVLPHLTCVGHSKDDLHRIVTEFKDSGFQGIMALRGDPPKGEKKFKPHPNGLRYASDLVHFLKQNYPNMEIGVAGYPEKHPEASNLSTDLHHLKTKVDQGARFITTQLFFRNEDYFRFVEDCRKAGITQPILPGILPAISWKQVSRFCQMCGANIPSELAQELESVSGDTTAEQEIGVNWARKQITELLKSGAPGFHLYILNRSAPALQLMHELSLDLGKNFFKKASYA